MRNDGYTLDAKRQPIEGSDIPDIIARFNNLSNEDTRTRKDQSFFVTADEIRKNDYDLTINKYKVVEREKKAYRSSEEILADIKKQRDEKTYFVFGRYADRLCSFGTE
jgi:type I restriction enzyme M protein